MKKNDLFTFTAPNGVKVQAIVLDMSSHLDCFNNIDIKYLCYSQNRLFNYLETWWFDRGRSTYKVGDIIADYVIIPEYDEKLKLYAAMDYPQWEQNLEEEIQGTNDR